MKYKSIFISDVHLGTRFSKAKLLLNFFKHNECENLILVGDIIDGWSIKRKLYWPQEHSDVIQKILKKAKKGTKVTFITGNHDEFLRPFVPLLLGNSINISNELEYIALNGKKYYITHGDFFDSITMTKKWLAVLGDYGYDLLLHLNSILNFFRKLFGIRKYWSLSKYVKDNVKSSVSFINDFESVLANHARNKAYDGIICGHIHKAEIKLIDEIEYLNCGDWVESCTAIVETFDGKFEIIDWLEKNATK
ncbi:MAG: UDP-2,3-diacylglucosamine diphosphatase [Aliarcobacter sp.]|uniref:YbbF/LpxH family metallophosphatase n=1 Tax=Arcobacter aquimarinus TaxID=1315211 RepID=A0AAE7B7P6_9BACT|nr:UDP-2,3-diacylglucosamine diphosphatase [Arcobacter aquimarinus]MCB9097669.1 UDP-2,3-diacylglucosamine diphosphatase [Arcobacter sp.]QKE27147.1 YbbF/LpxH family metallophosphatase [Arcobacter aquimarinus]RXI35511.1 UDP-2,3-diacylglucosamine hydrolase [Arcobacter aquimarinus]